MRLAQTKIVLEGKLTPDSRNWVDYHRIDGQFIMNWVKNRLVAVRPSSTTHMRITIETFREE